MHIIILSYYRIGRSYISVTFLEKHPFRSCICDDNGADQLLLYSLYRQYNQFFFQRPKRQKHLAILCHRTPYNPVCVNPDGNPNQRTNVPVNAHLISGSSTVQSAKRLYPSRSRSNKKRIKFLAKPTQNPRKILAKSTLLPRYFHAYFSLWQRELREISRLFHV